MANPEILVPIHLPGRRHHGSLPKEQHARNAPGPYQVLKLQRMRDSLSDADPDLRLGLEKVQRLGMHPLHGVYRCMPRGSALAKVPVEIRDSCPTVRCGAGGGSRTHFSHPFHGCLLRVATRRVCSPSPEPIGLRWTSQPRPRAPGNLDRACWNRISLLKIEGAHRI